MVWKQAKDGHYYKRKWNSGTKRWVTIKTGEDSSVEDFFSGMGGLIIILVILFIIFIVWIL